MKRECIKEGVNLANRINANYILTKYLKLELH